MKYSVIDCHHHMMATPGYVDALVKECDVLGIERVCLIAPGVENGNDLLAKEIRKYPKRICGFALIDWNNDKPMDIEKYKEMGLTGLKFIRPIADYHDERWFPLYEKAEELEMPGLFHLGIVGRSNPKSAFQGPAGADLSKQRSLVDSSMMRPVFLDSVARSFPTWMIIGAHLGNPWYEEAAMSARWNPNLFFDLSGSTLKKKTPEFLGALLWWTPYTRYKDPEGRYAWEKIVFGSDVSHFEIRDVIRDYEHVMEKLNLPEDIRKAVFGGTARRILGLD